MILLFNQCDTREHSNERAREKCIVRLPSKTRQAPDNALITLIRGTQVVIMLILTPRALALPLLPKLKATHVLQ